jgi:hypothetical protein
LEYQWGSSRQAIPIGAVDYAWNSFEDAFKKGIFFNGRRK